MSDAIEQGYEVILNHLMRELDWSDEQLRMANEALAEISIENHNLRGLLANILAAMEFSKLDRAERHEWKRVIRDELDNRNDTNAA